MFSDLLSKLAKSEFVLSLIALLAMFLAPKLGLPVEDLKQVIYGILGLTATYIAGRSYAKPREMASGGGPAPASPLPPAV